MDNEEYKVEVECEKLDNFFDTFEKDYKKRCNKIVDELADFALEEMQRNYANAEHQAGGEDMGFVKTGDAEEKTVSMVGEQSWYVEFGTGTRGSQNPHPRKRMFNLNPYNSGRTIRRATTRVANKPEAIAAGITKGSKYWTYKGKDGQKHYTIGIPAQRIVYNTAKAVEQKIPEIADKYLKGIFK